ncbi:TetR family transcriptional regulator [Enemella dayhoffiae]|uniref:TetR family transcriptional regulator n=1 Tax=Enemella dayhoffiae TaxID=2016507 RepID=A0A255H324_9ACTN|nr:TetR/AcrR family transcriptional regulator [Enemella dayhoffiae]OYO21999.1 TetR family transcriptional regulator [Enemella dayhoffiae]
MNKRRGRPAGGGSSAEAIRAAARRLFVARGYRGTTLRAVAAECSVDVAAVSYHFGSKSGLFAAAMALPMAPSALLRGVLDQRPERVGPVLVAAVVEAWERPEVRAAMVTMLGQATSEPEVARALAAYLEQELVAPLVEYLRGHGAGQHARERAAGLIALAGGTLLTRYVLEVPTLAGLDVEELVRAMTVPATAVLDGGVRRR